MYENQIIKEPKWKSWIIQTTTPLFTPDQCRQIIECGHRQPPQTAQVGMNKPGGGTDTVKELQQYLGYHLKKWDICIVILDKFIQKLMKIILVLETLELQKMHNLQNIHKVGFMIGIWTVILTCNMNHLLEKYQ